MLELGSFQSFLFLLGSFFVPLFAVLLADWLASGRRYEPEDVFGRPGPCASGCVAAWIAGFAAYQWLSPTGPTWWVEQVQRLDPPAWGIGATLPSFAVSFVLALAVSAAHGPCRRRGRARVSRHRAHRQPRARPSSRAAIRGPAAGSSTPPARRSASGRTRSS